MVRKYKEPRIIFADTIPTTFRSNETTPMEDPDETVCIALPNISSIDAAWDDPPDSDPTPHHALGDERDVATAYLLGTQRCGNSRASNQSGEINTRAERLVLQMIHAPLVESARIQIDRLKRGCATEEAIIIIELAMSTGLHFEDIEESLTEPEYNRIKSNCRRQTAIRIWHKIQQEPSLLGIIQIQQAIKRGDVSLTELYTREGKYEQAIKGAHKAFADHVINLLKRNSSSKELFALLRVAIEVFHVNIDSLSITLPEYRTLIQLYEFAS